MQYNYVAIHMLGRGEENEYNMDQNDRHLLKLPLGMSPPETG